MINTEPTKKWELNSRRVRSSCFL